jgi:hypothetical protein
VYYVFEDKSGCAFERLIKSVYPDNVAARIEFRGNNSRAISKCEQLLIDGEYVCLYMDMPPGNQSIIEMYNNKVLELSRRYSGHFIVIPVICSEYLILKTIMNDKNLLTNNDAVYSISVCGNYLKSPVYKDEKDLEKYPTAEKCCKLILKREAKDCVTNLKRLLNVNTGKYENNKMYEKFYDINCDKTCTNSNENCMIVEKSIKAKRVLLELRAFPVGVLGEKTAPIESIEALWKIHDELIDTLNRYSEYLSSVDNVTNNVYKKYEHLER